MQHFYPPGLATHLLSAVLCFVLPAGCENTASCSRLLSPAENNRKRENRPQNLINRLTQKK